MSNPKFINVSTNSNVIKHNEKYPKATKKINVFILNLKYPKTKTNAFIQYV